MKKFFIGIMFFLLVPFSVLAKVDFIKGDKVSVTLSSCIDGDTAKFNTDIGIKSVRFLAIDTPESTTKVEEYGVTASEFTCNKLMKAKEIVLEFDKNSDLYDKYNRLLAWIFVDDKLLQDEIIKEGFGEVAYLYGNYKYTSLLQDHESIAKVNKLNIWKNTGINKASNNNSSFEDFENNELVYIILILLFIIYYLRKKFKRLVKHIIKKPF